MATYYADLTPEEQEAKNKQETEEKNYNMQIDYDEPFMLELMAVILRERSIADVFIPNLRPLYFEKRPSFQILFSVIRDYYNAIQDIPHTKHDLMTQFVDYQEQHPAVNVDDRLLTMIDAIYQKENGVFTFQPNISLIKIKTIDFIKRAVHKKGLMDAMNELRNSNYDALWNKLDKVKTIVVTQLSQKPLDAFIEDQWVEELQTIETRTHKLNRFKQIGEHTDGIASGLYIVAADTHKGKTNLVCNIAVDLLESNDDTSIIHFSLDDSKKIAFTRLYSIMTDIPINQVNRPIYDMEQALKKKAVKEQLQEWYRQGRFMMYDIGDSPDMKDIELIVRNKQKEKLVIIVDGLFNADMGNGKGGIREENIQRATRLKNLVDLHDIPVITTGEVRKRYPIWNTKIGDYVPAPPPTANDIMETGKFAFNASCIITLYPEDQMNEVMPTYNLIADFGKNKICGWMGEQKLHVRKTYARMEENNDNSY